MHTPLARYQADLKRPDFHHDAAQEAAVRHLHEIYQQLTAPIPKKGWFRRREERPKIKGVYMWGGVGRGKTYLMAVCFESLLLAAKPWTHVHRVVRRTPR